MVFYIVKKKRSLPPFALKFPNFRPKIRMFSKKKGLHFHLLSNFRIFVRKSGCSLKKSVVTSGGYSNLGARGKNFQKLMLSEKKKRSDLGLNIFLPKSSCSLKKKKKGLHFDFISDFPIFLPKSRCSLKKKKKRSSLRIVL